MKNYMFLKKFSQLTVFLIIFVLLNSCGKNFFRGADARKVDPDPRKRVQKNLEEGKVLGLLMPLRKESEEVEILNLQVLTNYGEHH